MVGLQINGERKDVDVPADMPLIDKGALTGRKPA